MKFQKPAGWFRIWTHDLLFDFKKFLHIPNFQFQVLILLVDYLLNNNKALMLLPFLFRLPYTEACILEFQRLGSIVPMAVPHRTLEDVHMKGKIIDCCIFLPNFGSSATQSWVKISKFVEKSRQKKGVLNLKRVF